MPRADPAGYRCWPQGCQQALLCLLQHQAPTCPPRCLTPCSGRLRHAPAAQPEPPQQRFGCHQAPPTRGVSSGRTAVPHGIASRASRHIHGSGSLGMGGWERLMLQQVQTRRAAPATQPHAPGQPPTFGPHGRRAVVRHRREDTGVIADVGVGLPADVAVVRVEGGGAGDEIGTN